MSNKGSATTLPGAADKPTAAAAPVQQATTASPAVAGQPGSNVAYAQQPGTAYSSQVQQQAEMQHQPVQTAQHAAKAATSSNPPPDTAAAATSPAFVVPVLAPNATADEGLEVLRTICACIKDLITGSKYDDLCKCIVELKRIEMLQSDIGYANYFPLVVPSLLLILRSVPVTMMKNSQQQQLRSSTLSMIHRLPSSEFLRKFLKEILTVVTDLLDKENEENVLICLKVIVEKYRSFRPTLPELVQRFMAFVLQMYKDFNTIVQMMNSTDESSRKKLQEYLQTKIKEKSDLVAGYQKELSDMEQLYSTRHSEYQKLQTAANKMTQERKVLDQQLQANRQAQIQASQNGLPITPAQTLEYNRLNLEVTNILKPLNDNISKQQTVHAQLTSFKNKYMETQASMQRCQQEIRDLQAQQQQLQALEREAAAHPTNSEGSKPAVICRGNRSFKVLADCRNIVILLLQLYKDIMTSNIEAFVPNMVQALNTPVIIDGSDPTAVENHLKYISSQVKTLWFLTFCMNRNQGEVVKPHASQLSSRVMFLLRNTPAGAVTVRKELLIATRQLLTLEPFRAGFLSELNNLMTEDVLLGKGWTSQESLKPLAFSTLADLLHHVRDKLTMDQLTRAIHMFLRNVLDNGLPLQIQTMSCKLLLNLVQILAHKLDTQGLVRNLLVQILHTFVIKLGSLRAVQLERILSNARRNSKGPKVKPVFDITSNDHYKLSDVDVIAPLDAHRVLLPIPVHQISTAYVDGIKDCRFLLKTLINGVKTIVWGIQTANDANKGTNARTRLLMPEETILFHRLLSNGLKCFDAYSVTLDETIRPLNTSDTKPSQEEKETIDTFANIFASCDPALFREVFISRMPELVEAVVNNNLLLVYPQLILSNKSVSTCFANNLLEYLLSRLPQLGDENVCQVLLRLFKLVFGSVNLFAEVNEKILQPHLSYIIHKSMSLATTASNPENYFLLLRALFRSIGGGKFEELYKEFLPLLPALLNGLNRLQECAHRTFVRDLFVELCLTVPVRLSALLPYLHYLMRPLVLALQSSEELVSQGLRTLELCIDNLSPEFLAPIIEPVRVELMNALWRHMKPQQPSTSQSSRASLHGAITFRLLGKLGGRNRCVFKHPPVVTPRGHKGPALRVALTFDYSSTIYVAIDSGIKVAVSTLKDDPSPTHQDAAFSFLKSCFCGLMNLDPIGSVSAHRSLFPYGTFENLRAHAYFAPEKRPGDWHSLFCETVEGLFIAANRSSLKDIATTLLYNIVTHCVLLSISLNGQEQSKAGKSSPQIDPSLIVEPLFKSMASEEDGVAELASGMLDHILKTALTVFGKDNIALASQTMLVSAMCYQACTSCYNREWYSKKAGCTGIQFLVDNMPHSWIMSNQLKLNKALLFTVMDLYDQIGMGVAAQAEELVLRLVTKCFENTDQGVSKKVPVVTAPSTSTSTTAETPKADASSAVNDSADSGDAMDVDLPAKSTQISEPKTAAIESDSNAALEDKKVEMHSTNQSAPSVTEIPSASSQSTGVVEAASASAEEKFKTVDTELGKLNKLLATELVCPDDRVRKLVHKIFDMLSKYSKLSLHDLLSHTSAKTLTLPKTTRNCSINVQVGRMDAITYCLKLDPPLIKIPSGNDNESTHRGANNSNYIREVLEICKLDDVRARNAMRPGSPVNPAALVTLRQKAIELVGAVVTFDNWADLRESAVKYFVAALLTEHDVIAESAGAALVKIQTVAAPPKEMMQNALRPIVEKLADYRAFSLPLLRSISRLLGLLPISAFNEKFGEKMIEHWGKWLSHVTNEANTGAEDHASWKDTDAALICKAIIQLLPKLENSGRFLASIIESVSRLEVLLGRYQSSPYREPLLSYLEAYATESVQHFLQKLESTEQCTLYRNLLRLPEAVKLRAATVAAIDSVVQTTFNMPINRNQPTPTSASPAIPIYRRFYEGIAIVNTVVDADPQYVSVLPKVIGNVRKMWDDTSFTATIANPEVVTFYDVVNIQSFIGIQLKHVQTTQSSIEDLFKCLEVLGTNALIDNAFLVEFSHTEVAETFPNNVKKEILLHLTSLLEQNISAAASTKMQTVIKDAIYTLCIPILVKSLGRKDVGEVLGNGTDGVVPRWIKAVASTDHSCDDSCKIAIMQFTTILVRCAKLDSQVSATFTDAVRNEYLKFAWTRCFECDTSWDVSDISVKYSGYVLVCETLVGLDLSPKETVLEVFKVLSEKHQGEHSKLIRKALDIIHPLLPHNVPAADENAIPEWVQVICDIVTRDNLPQTHVQHVWSMIVRHADKYYPYRKHILMWIVQALSRVLSTVNAQPDTRKLPIDVAELLINWEERALKEKLVSSNDSTMRVETATSAAASQIALSDVHKMSPKMQEGVVNFLTLSACSTSDVQGSTVTAAQISSHCIMLLGKVLVPGMWLSAGISIGRCDKLLQQCKPDLQPNHPYRNYINTLTILQLLLERLDTTAALHQVGQLHTGLCAISLCKHSEIAEAFLSILKKLLSICPFKVSRDAKYADHPEVSKLYKLNFKFISQTFEQFERESPATMLHALKTCEVFYEHNRTYVDPFMVALTKVTAKYHKDHLSAANSQAAASTSTAKSGASNAAAAAAVSNAATSAASPVDKANLEKCLILALKLSLPSMLDSDHPQRKPYLSLVQAAAEKSPSAAVVGCVASICGDALMVPTREKDKNQAQNTLREKVVLFNKISSSLIKRFPKHEVVVDVFQRVLDIFNSSAELAITDLLARLEGVFMLGLVAKNASIREQFFKLFQAPCQDASLHGCLDYCFSDKYQRWESSKNNFWIKHCLDIILAASSKKQPVCPAPSVIRLPALLPLTEPAPPGSNLPPRGLAMPSIPPRFKDIVKEAVALTTKHDLFLTEMRKMTSREFIEPLRTLCFLSHDLALQLWTGLFPLLWHILEPRGKDSVAGMMSSLLAQDYHTDQTLIRPNNVQALLIGISKCVQPMNGLEPSLLYHLAKSHNLWHTVIVMLRTQALNRSENGNVADGRIDPIQDALGDLYMNLNETDTWFGLWRLRAKLSKSAKALAYEQQGYWEKAQIQYEDVMQTAAHHGIRDAEFQLWETHWMQCGQQLGNHELLLKFAEETKNQDLLLKSAWKLKSWKKLKDTLRRVQIADEPSKDIFLSKGYHIIATQDEINMGTIEKIFMEATTFALQSWASLPSVVSHSHVQILEAAQRFVELQESADLCMALAPGSSTRQPTQDLSNLVEMWRKRLPNEWDDINIWHELLVWRLFIFEKIGSTAKGAIPAPTPDARVTFANNEIAWTVNKLTSIARKHKLKSLCDKNLAVMYKFMQSGGSKNDLFQKTKEHVLCNIELLPDDYKSQIDTINSINLQQFTQSQSAELYAYKGKVLHQMGSWEDANKVFSAALALSEDLAVGWEHWAIYCDDMFSRVCESIRQLKAEASQSGKRQKTEAATESNAREWAKSAMTCYLHACRSYADDEKIKRMIAKCLVLLAYDDATGEVGQTFSRLSDLIDTSVWKFWIPQLLMSVARPEAKYVHNLLVRLAKINPQALYYSLRTAYLEIRASDAVAKQQKQLAAKRAASTAPSEDEDGQAKRQRLSTGAAKETGTPTPTATDSVSGSTSDTTPSQPGHQSPASELQHVSNIMQNLRIKHSMLAGTLENMIEDLVARFKPTPEEEFLRTTQVLFEECLKHALAQIDRAQEHWLQRSANWHQAFPEATPVPPQITSHLRRVLETFFTPQNSQMLKYRSRFESDFGNMSQMSLDSCLRRLHEWHRHMSILISRMPKNHRLEDFSHFLMTFSGAHAEIDLPGEHLVRNSFSQQSHTFIRIERFLPQVKVVHKHSAAYRQVIIRGRDGRLYPYLIQQASTRHARTEERFMHFLRMLNMMMDKRKEARKRALVYNVPRVIPLNVHVRLVQQPASVMSLEDVFREFCISNQSFVDQPIIDSYSARRREFLNCHKQIKDYVASGRTVKDFFAAGDPTKKRDPKEGGWRPTASVDVRKEIFDTLRRKKVPMDIFNRFMRASFPDHTDLWMFQRQFTCQLALNAFASYFLMLTKGAPHTLLFAHDTGNVYPWDMNVTINTNGAIVAPEPVPFRLTPNLVSFISPIGITGLFSSAIIAAAEAVNDPEFRVQNYLGTLLKDEMISWHANNREPYAKSAISNVQLVTLVEVNTRSISNRLSSLGNYDGNNKDIDNLIKQATGTKNLCNMPPMWQPWL